MGCTSSISTIHHTKRVITDPQSPKSVDLDALKLTRTPSTNSDCSYYTPKKESITTYYDFVETPISEGREGIIRKGIFSYSLNFINSYKR